MTSNKNHEGLTAIDAQRRQVVTASLAVIGTASTGILAGCGGGSSSGGRADVTPLTLMWMSPANGATNAGVDTRMTLVFSESVTVGSNAISVTGPGGAVATATTMSGANVTLTPVNPLSPGQKYTITITSAVKGAAGNAYAGSTASFTTTAQALSLAAGAMVSDSYYAYRWSSPPAHPWDVLQYLRRDGFRWLRMWVTTLTYPELRTTSDWSNLPWQNGYWACLEASGAVLAAAAALGFRLQAVLFLTDQAAHAGQQPLAAAWAGFTPAQLAVAVQQSAADTASYYQSLGLNIEVFEIGNEIDFGVCGIYMGTTVPVPAGVDPVNTPSWMEDNIWGPSAPLLKAAISGVLSVYPNAKILLHIAGVGYSRGDIAAYSFFQSMVNLGVPFDIAGLSYPYMFSGGDVPQPYFAQADFLSALDAIAAVGKPIQIVEFDYPAAPAGITKVPSPSYPFTPTGQAIFVQDFANAVNRRVESLGYWYADYYLGWPDAANNPELVSSGLFSAYDAPRPALAVFKQPPFAT
jgi:arabinogalactan endo-1,4-beta-galactosidase